jgi:DNA-binding beta-propeller fold protein YncE
MFFDGTYLYVSSSLDAAQTTSLGGAIYKFNTSGTLVSTVSSTIKWPFSVAVYSSSVFAVATDTAGSGSTGLINLTSSTTPVVTALSSPYGVGIDSANTRVYVSDVGGGTYANSVVVYSIGSYGAPLTFVSIGSSPSGIAYESSLGYMYVTRQSATSEGVYKINTSTYAASTLVSSSFGSIFNNPTGIAVRSSYKEVYVANTGTTAGDTDSSILKITYDSSGNATAVTTFLSGTSTSSMLCGPVGLAINGNVLYISNGTCTTNSAYAKSVIKVTLDS